jgi:DNA-binding protein HU-beta
MTKNDFVSSVAEKAGLSKADAKKAIDAFCETVSDVLKAGDKLSLVGFGTFSVAERGERQGINPLTKQPITIAAKKSAKFKGGKELTDALN